MIRSGKWTLTKFPLKMPYSNCVVCAYILCFLHREMHFYFISCSRSILGIGPPSSVSDIQVMKRQVATDCGVVSNYLTAMRNMTTNTLEDSDTSSLQPCLCIAITNGLEDVIRDRVR